MKLSNILKKISITLFFYFASISCLACPDFSGEFTSHSADWGEFYLIVQQKKCDYVLLTYKYSDGFSFQKKMILDGVARVIFDENQFRTIESFQIISNQIFSKAELFNKISGGKSKAKGIISLDAERNLIENKTIMDWDENPLHSVAAVFFRINR